MTETPSAGETPPSGKPLKRQRGPKETLLLARSHLLRTALALSILAPLAILAGVLGVRTGRLSYQTGYQLLSMGIAPVLATLGILLGALGLLSALLVSPRKGLVMGLIAVALGGLVMFGITRHRLAAAEHPPIHDVATDWRDPIIFTPKMLAIRGDKANPVELSPVVPEGPRGRFLGQPVAMINAQTCPGATPIVLQSDTPFAYLRARRAVNNFGWTIVTDDRDAGRLEATARSLWLNLPYDVAVRVRPEGAGARVDIRAIARYGQADRGADCQLVTRLRKAME